LALKIGIFKLIAEKKKETPAFLLDDVYSEIDTVREKAFNDCFMDLKQVFITTHDQNMNIDLPERVHKDVHYIHISNNDLYEKRII
jgi:recombinational DNA repair ATPase RecF